MAYDIDNDIDVIIARRDLAEVRRSLAGYRANPPGMWTREMLHMEQCENHERRLVAELRLLTA